MLAVEDEPLTATVVQNAIKVLGFETIGPVDDRNDALALASVGEFDCAILDVNIRGGDSYDVADLLLDRGRPFVLATGYSEWSIPHRLVGAKRLTKPYTQRQLEDELRLMHERVQGLTRAPRKSDENGD